MDTGRELKTDIEKFRRTRSMILMRVLLAPFIIVMIVCGTLVYFFADNIRTRTNSELARVARDHRRLVEQFLSERTADLSFVATSFSFEQLSSEMELAEVLRRLQLRSPAFVDLGVFDSEGNHIAYFGPYNLEGKNYAGEEWFLAMNEKSVYISDVFLGFRNSPHFIIAVRAGDENNRWVLRGTIDSMYFDNLVENVRVGRTGEAYLVNQDGLLQSDRRSGGSLMEQVPEDITPGADSEEIEFMFHEDEQGENWLYAAGGLEATGWMLIVRQKASEAYAPLARATLASMAIILAGGAVVLVIAYLLASGLADRLTVAAMEKREMSSHLIMAGKLAEVGEMSSGMAHEINNPLQVMMSEHAMIMDLLGPVQPGQAIDEKALELIKDSVDQIKVQIGRCSNITQGLLKFARKAESTFTSVNVGALVDETLEMIQNKAVVDGIMIRREIDAGLPEVMTDSGLLQQVVVNLVNNAMYAAADGSDEPLVMVSCSRDGDDLNISIADNGTGISPENMEKIFMPFFTTKPVGKGTGLGLSTCFGIVQKLGGVIKVSSEPGAGAVFTVHLPAAGKEDTGGNGKKTIPGGTDHEWKSTPVNRG